MMRKKEFAAIFLLLAALTLSSCLRARDTFYFGSYSEAEAYFNRGEYERAIQKYQAYIDENPEGNLALIAEYYIGRSHAALGHADEAKNIFQQIVAKYPDTVWAQFSQAQLNEAPATAPPAAS